jgi:hypothetical protein
MPIYYYVMPVIVLAFVAYTFVMRRRGLASTTHATVGSLAQRLGLQLIQGDPSINLYYLAQPNRNYKRNIQLVGAPYGREVKWDLTDGTRSQDFLVLVKVTTTWGCFLVARVNAHVPDFEITLRNPNQYLVPERSLPHLPEAPTGDPSIDSAYRVAIADPRYAPSLAPAIKALAGQIYVHVIGQGGVVMIPITRVGLSYFVHAAEQYLYALEVLACTLEGRQPPATIAAPGQAAAPDGLRGVPQSYQSPYGR